MLIVSLHVISLMSESDSINFVQLICMETLSHWLKAYKFLILMLKLQNLTKNVFKSNPLFSSPFCILLKFI